MRVHPHRELEPEQLAPGQVASRRARPAAAADGERGERAAVEDVESDAVVGVAKVPREVHRVRVLRPKTLHYLAGLGRYSDTLINHRLINYSAWPSPIHHSVGFIFSSQTFCEVEAQDIKEGLCLIY